MDLFDTAAEAEKELDASGATLLEDAEELTLESLTENDFCFAIPFLLQTWFALVPRGCRAPEMDFAELEQTFVSNLRQLETCVRSGHPEKTGIVFAERPATRIDAGAAGRIPRSRQYRAQKVPPRSDAQPVILALLKSIVEKLDEALRRKS